MITDRQIFNDKEWIGRLENIFKLEKILNKDYWIKYYVSWICVDIFTRREKNKSINNVIKELEDKILNII